MTSLRVSCPGFHFAFDLYLKIPLYSAFLVLQINLLRGLFLGKRPSTVRSGTRCRTLQEDDTERLYTERMHKVTTGVLKAIVAYAKS